MSKLVDYSPGTGVYEGDLKYGRANGVELQKHKDYPANRVDGVPTNKPVAPLITVQPRDRNVWKKDPRVKQARREVQNSQNSINTIIESYREAYANLHANITLIVGRQKM